MEEKAKREKNKQRDQRRRDRIASKRRVKWFKAHHIDPTLSVPKIKAGADAMTAEEVEKELGFDPDRQKWNVEQKKWAEDSKYNLLSYSFWMSRYW